MLGHADELASDFSSWLETVADGGRALPDWCRRLLAR
jgi:hypothetical protein